MVKEYTLPLGQKLNPQRNPHTMDYQKLYRHMAIEHGLFLLDSQMEEIVDIVLEMHNEKPETCTEVIKNPSNNDQMKTAMQEMFDKLNNVKPTQYCSIQTILGWAEFLLEIEKDQIVNAYKEGCFDGGFFDEKWDEERAKEYYKETYTNPDRDENGRI